VLHAVRLHEALEKRAPPAADVEHTRRAMRACLFRVVVDLSELSDAEVHAQVIAWFAQKR
jgi:hypothetical protein